MFSPLTHAPLAKAQHGTAQHRWGTTAMQRNSSSNVILIHCTYSTAQQQQPHTLAASQQGGCPAGGKKVVGVWCRGTAFAHTHRHQHCAAHPARQAKPVVHKHKESTRTHVSWCQNRTTGGRGVAHATACLVLCGALQPPKTPKPWHTMPYLPRQGKLHAGFGTAAASGSPTYDCRVWGDLYNIN